MIDRQVFLEYTRKMNLKKHCLSRIHVAQISSHRVVRYVNSSIGNQDPKIQNREIAIAKQVPFSKNLKEIEFTKENEEYKRMLMHLLSRALKDESFCNAACEQMSRLARNVTTVHLFYGSYEVPQKRLYEEGSSASVTENESGEVYDHVICCMCDKDNRVVKGMMYPAYMKERYGDKDRLDIM